MSDAGSNANVPFDRPATDGNGNTNQPLPLDLRGLRRLVDDPSVPDTGEGDPPVVDMGAIEVAG